MDDLFNPRTTEKDIVNDNNGRMSISGNWTKNPRIENYILINDIEPFNHNKEWMSERI